MTSPRRFYSLDAIRGIAALAVVFNHWKHFSMVGTGGETWTRAESPLYAQLFWLYEYGWVAVDFFFSLSGFVFFWLYGEKVARGEVAAGRFARLRFSRLYPLHLATLFGIAGLQLLHRNLHGGFWVYADNDLPHFLQHLVFASGLVPQGGDAFNAPVWSVSIEVVMYAAFFALCRRPWGRRVSTLLVLVGLGFVLQLVHANLGRGLASFFLGGLTHHAYVALVARARSPESAVRLRRACLTVLVGAVALVVAQLRYEWFSDAARAVAELPLVAERGPTAQKIVGRLPGSALLGLVFPAVVLALALLETLRGPLLKPVARLGDWSYAAYLLHVPLQLAVVLLTRAAGLDSGLFREPLALPAFFALLCVFSQLSYRFYERPMQDRLRRRS